MKLVRADQSWPLSLDFVRPPIHVINTGKVVCALDDRPRVARRSELLLEVGLFSQHAHLGNRSATIETCWDGFFMPIPDHTLPD